MSRAVTPLPVEASPNDKGQRLQFYRSRISNNIGNWIVFDEVRVDDLESLLNHLDGAGYEIYDVKAEPHDPGYRARWIVLAYRIAEVPTS